MLVFYLDTRNHSVSRSPGSRGKKSSCFLALCENRLTYEDVGDNLPLFTTIDGEMSREDIKIWKTFTSSLLDEILNHDCELQLNSIHDRNFQLGVVLGFDVCGTFPVAFPKSVK